MTFAEAINDALVRAREAAEGEPLDKLTREYLRVFRAVARDVATRFQKLADPVGTQAAAGWPAPSVDEVMAIIMETSRIRDAQRTMMAFIAGPFAGVEGVDFNLTHPVVQDMLDKLGARVEGTIRAGVREPVARAIAENWAKGTTIPDTAKSIRAAVTGVQDWQATMLARTDRNALSNGSGHWAVEQLNAGAKANNEPPVIGSRTWTNAGDSRVRETHQAAEGQTVPMNESFKVGTAYLAYPGDPSGPHEEVVNCRCVEIFNEPEVRGGREDVAAEEGPPPEPKERFATRINFPGAPQLGRTPTSEAVGSAAERALVAFDDALPGGMSKEMIDQLEITDGILNIRLNRNMAEHGQYVFFGRRPGQINLSDVDDEPYNTIWHELGHYLDHQALRPGFSGTWATSPTHVPTKAMQEFIAAVERTRAHTRLRQAESSRTTLNSVGQRVGLSDAQVAYVEYALGLDEVWARAFAQWMVKHHGDELSRSEFRALMTKQRNRVLNSIQDQWEDDDFELIDKAIENVLREAGLLDDLGLTASFWRLLGHEVDVRSLAPVVGGKPPFGHRVVEAVLPLDGPDDLVVGRPGVPHRFDIDQHPTDDTPTDGVRSTPTEEVQVPNLKLNKPTPLMLTGPRALIPDPPSVVTIRAAVDPEGRTMWHSDMCFEGVSTGDGRFMVPGSLSSRELPLTLMAMIETPDFGGHAGAEVSGRIDTFDKRDVDMNGAKLPTGVQSVYSTGVFDQGSFAQDIERMVDDQVLRGVSVDLAVFEWALRDPETGELIDPMEATDEQWERAFMGELEFAVVEGEVMAATVCPTPAFADARIAILASGVSPSFARTWLAGPEYAAKFGVDPDQLMTTIVATATGVFATIEQDGQLVGFVATGAHVSQEGREGIAPLKPNRDVFFTPEPDGPQPITVDEHGGLTGHLALWETCHTGYSNGSFAECITPPRSGTDYSEFHLMPLVCEDGSQVLVGKLTVGTGHADPHLGIIPARAHYDDTGSVAGYVRAIDGKHGIWLSGCTRSDMTDEQLRDLRVNPPSGDWRGPRGALELLAALAVVCPGFPVPQIGLAADGLGVFMQTLILAAGVDTVDGHVILDTVDADVLDATMNGPEGLDELIQG